jgi:hypothetical protein
VHLIPHSHNDLGWLITFREYYYGYKYDVIRLNVREIINNYIVELQKNPNRKFIQV